MTEWVGQAAESIMGGLEPEVYGPEPPAASRKRCERLSANEDCKSEWKGARTMMDIKIYQINLSRDDDSGGLPGTFQLISFRRGSKVNKRDLR